MTLKAYQNTQRATEDPARHRIPAVRPGHRRADRRQEDQRQRRPLVEAIDWNRRLWRTLAADCMDDRNALTQDVRAKIVSLSLWVSKYSRR